MEPVIRQLGPTVNNIDDKLNPDVASAIMRSSYDNMVETRADRLSTRLLAFRSSTSPLKPRLGLNLQHGFMLVVKT
jgi:hypothetical protein